MSETPSRRNNLGYVAGGGALLGGGIAADAMVDADRRRRGLKGPIRSLSDRGRRVPGRVWAGTGVKTVSTGVKAAGIPMMAYGGWNLARGRKAPELRGRDVAAQAVRGATFVDAAQKAGPVVKSGELTPLQRYRWLEFHGGLARGAEPPAALPGEVDSGPWSCDLVAKAELTAAERDRLGRHKSAGRALSLTSGTLGVGALALRAPELARAASRVRPLARVRAVQRLAGKEQGATRASNTLGVGAIGIGSAGSFNYAAQQKLERKQVVKGMRDRVDRNAWRWERSDAAAGVRRAAREKNRSANVKDLAAGAVVSSALPVALTGVRAYGDSALGARTPVVGDIARAARMVPLRRPSVNSRRAFLLNPVAGAVDFAARNQVLTGRAARVARVASHPATLGVAGLAASVPLYRHARRDADRYRQQFQDRRDSFIEDRARAGVSKARVRLENVPLDQLATTGVSQARKRRERSRAKVSKEWEQLELPFEKRDDGRRRSGVAEAAVGAGLVGVGAGGNRIAFGGQRRYADFVDYASRRESEYLEGRFPHGIAPDGRPHVPFVAPSGPLVGGRPPALPREQKQANKDALKRKYGRLSAINERRNRLHASSLRAVRPVAGALIGTGLIAGPVLAWHGSRRAVSKDLSRRDVDAAFAGAAVPVVAYHGALYGTKPLVDSRLDAAIRADPNAVKAIAERRKELGLSERGKGVIAGDPRMKPFFRSYPKSVDMPVSLSVAGRSVRTPVKAWQWKRGMSYAQGGKTQLGVTAALAGAGALSGVGLSRRRRRSRAARVEKAMFPSSYGLRLRKPAIRSSYIGTSRLGRKFTVRGSVGV